MIPVKIEKIQPIGNHNKEQECVCTESVAHLVKYPYSHLNPMQSMFAPYVDEMEKNVVVSAKTCAGKTVVAELACAQTVFGSNRTKKAMYLAPMKALAEEKLRDWREPSHTFSALKVAALTSDYETNDAKWEELENADIILCTSEMLDSRSRKYDKNTWLHNVDLVIVDESHLIGVKERGPRLETAVMRFNSHNPQARLVFMSATCPNTKDYARWLNRLTKRKTLVLESNYRPCVLNKHFIAFDDTYANQKRKRYADMEMARMHAAMSIIQKYPNDQFLVFTGNKNWGKQFAPILQSRGFNCDFHNADLSPDRRRQLELDFNNGKINVLIASSTLSWGVNVNARRVILAHTSYGMTEMEVADIEQVCGRAGRVKYHNEGDAYILVQRSKEQLEIARISEGFEVKSRLNDINTLIFHVVNEVNNGNIYDAKSLLEWYERSLAAVQEDRLTIENATRVLEFLERKNMIRTNEETGRYEVTQLGVVSSLMYMHPLDVYDWYRNFSDLEKIGISKTLDGSNKNEVATNDLKVCLALADINKNKNGDAFISSAERETDAVVDFCNRTGKPASAVTKAASVYYAMLNDKEVDDPLRSLHFGIVNDLPRVIGTLKAIHQRYGSPQAKNSTNICGWKYNAIEWDVLFTRLKYGVPRYLTPLASLPEIGKVLAKKLFENGVTSKSDVQSKRSLVESLIGSKRAKKLYDKLDKKV